MHNEDSTPEEFESHQLNREKVIAAGSAASIFIGPLKPGKYAFVGEFHERPRTVWSSRSNDHARRRDHSLPRILEAALLIGIIARGAKPTRRNRWLAAASRQASQAPSWSPVFTSTIGEFADGVGQRLLNAGVLGLAVLMLARTTSG